MGGAGGAGGRMGLIVPTVAALLGLAVVGAAPAQPSATTPRPADLRLDPPAPDLSGTTVRIPLTESGPGGKRLTLEATLYKPAGDGPYPVLLFNHGSTGGGAVAARAAMRPTEAFAQAGGTATLRLFPDFGSGGHRLVDRVDLWRPVADEFVRQLNLSPR